MQGDVVMLERLNALLVGELTAVDQYLLHAEIYADQGFRKLADKALHESDHERQHARALMQRILFLGGTPDLSKRHPLQTGTTVPQCLAADLAVELRVVQALKDAIVLAEQCQDFVSRQMLLVQLEDSEMDHAYFLEKQLRLIDALGIQNYLQSQVGDAREQGGA